MYITQKIAKIKIPLINSFKTSKFLRKITDSVPPSLLIKNRKYLEMIHVKIWNSFPLATPLPIPVPHLPTSPSLLNQRRYSYGFNLDLFEFQNLILKIYKFRLYSTSNGHCVNLSRNTFCLQLLLWVNMHLQMVFH